MHEFSPDKLSKRGRHSVSPRFLSVNYSADSRPVSKSPTLALGSISPTREDKLLNLSVLKRKESHFDTEESTQGKQSQY